MNGFLYGCRIIKSRIGGRFILFGKIFKSVLLISGR